MKNSIEVFFQRSCKLKVHNCFLRRQNEILMYLDKLCLSHLSFNKRYLNKTNSVPLCRRLVLHRSKKTVLRLVNFKFYAKLEIHFKTDFTVLVEHKNCGVNIEIKIVKNENQY